MADVDVEDTDATWDLIFRLVAAYETTKLDDNDDDAKNELQFLNAEGSRLRREISRSPEDSELKRRRELQDLLEINMHRHAQVEEDCRVAIVTQRAVKSGLVTSPTVSFDDIGECPLCLEDVIKPPLRHDSERHIYRPSCCGKVFCQACCQDLSRRVEAAALAHDNPRSTDAIRLTCRNEINRLVSCPFCRHPLVVDLAMYCQQLLTHAKSGKLWAHYLIGKRFLKGLPWSRYAPMDKAKALEHLKVAAEQGHVEAMDLVGDCYAHGFPERNIVQSGGKFHKYSLAAARRGHAFCQYVRSCNADETSEQEVIWCTLSAAQGWPEAEYKMAMLCRDGSGGLRKSLFTSIMWMRRAALQGHGPAQRDLAWSLIEAKRELFDGRGNFVGRSALPEAAFWFSQAENNLDGFCTPEFRPHEQCDNCFQTPPTGGKKCAKCKATLYCDKACQTKHWKLGHKICCQAVEQVRTIVKEISTRQASDKIVPRAWANVIHTMSRGRPNDLMFTAMY